MDKRLENLHRALHPRAIAVVGARQLDDYMWLRNLSTFAGPVYSVNIDPNEIPGIAALGITNYARLTDIPGPVDFVVVAVPRRAAPAVLRDAIAKGVAGVSMTRPRRVAIYPTVPGTSVGTHGGSRRRPSKRVREGSGSL